MNNSKKKKPHYKSAASKQFGIRLDNDVYGWYVSLAEKDGVSIGEFVKASLIKNYEKKNGIVNNSKLVEDAPVIKPPVPKWMEKGWVNPYALDLEPFEPLKHTVGSIVKYFDKSSGHYRKAEVMMIKGQVPVVRWLDVL